MHIWPSCRWARGCWGGYLSTSNFRWELYYGIHDDRCECSHNNTGKKTWKNVQALNVQNLNIFERVIRATPKQRWAVGLCCSKCFWGHISVWFPLFNICRSQIISFWPGEALLWKPLSLCEKRSCTIVNRGEWLWNPTNFFVVCFCPLFWPWPCTKHNSCTPYWGANQ